MFNALSGMSAAVFDDVPEDEPYPYVIIGEVVASEDNSHDVFGTDGLFMCHIWSQYNGFREAYEIRDEIMQRVNYTSIPMEGHELSNVFIKHVDTRSLRDPDKNIRHVAVKFHFSVRQNRQVA